MAAVASGLVVEEVEVAGPPTSPDLRGAGWVEASVMVAALAARLEGRGGPGTAIEITAPSGGRARVAVAASGAVSVEVWAGEVLDQATLRSYCIGAVHQALGWVRSEGIAVDADGRVHDLTIRSFGILSARRHSVDGRDHAPQRSMAGERLRRRLRRHRGRRLGGRRLAVGVADPPGRGGEPALGPVGPARPDGRSRGGGPVSGPAGPPVGPYSPVLRAGDWVVTSGQVGVAPGPDGRPTLVRGGTVAELRQALDNLTGVLEVHGATLADVVKTTVFLVDMDDYAAVNEVWTAAFGEHRPTRSAVAVAALPLGARVEVEAWALAPEA